MERQDIIVIVAGIAIVLIMAIFVKPALTGESVTFLPEGMFEPRQPSEPQVVDTTVTQPVYTPVATQAPTPIQTPSQPPTIPPTPIPTAPTIGLTWQPDPDNPMQNIPMVTYAEIVGKYTGITEEFVIPVPYWEVHYEITYDTTKTPEFSMDVHEIKGGTHSIIRTMTFKTDRKPDSAENRFYEGGYTYYITISAKDVERYKIEILVPEKYVV
jgi:hypothetical protein